MPRMQRTRLLLLWLCGPATKAFPLMNHHRRHVLPKRTLTTRSIATPNNNHKIHPSTPLFYQDERKGEQNDEEQRRINKHHAHDDTPMSNNWWQIFAAVSNNSPTKVSLNPHDDERKTRNDQAKQQSRSASSSNKGSRQTNHKDHSSSGIRPLTQNWWPVTTIESLDVTRPNPVELLEKKLVLWYSGTGGNNTTEEDHNSKDAWSCLDDACPHRFAPLSEGRVVPAFGSNSSNNDNHHNCLQCAYHGWEFTDNGACHRVPQQDQSNRHVNVRIRAQHYPLQFAAGMVWVWADPQNTSVAETIPLPLSSLMQRYDKHMSSTLSNNNTMTYMRDLPYGMELLGENLLDISHLPFSHHKVGTLRRKDGRPVPLQMLSKHQRNTIAQRLVKEYHDYGSNDNNNSTENNTSLTQALVLPTYQASVVDAAFHDPELVAAYQNNPLVQRFGRTAAAVSHVAFFAPNHVRYHRNPGLLLQSPGGAYEVQLFLTPTGAGKSRVFLMTPSEARLPVLVEEEDEEDEDGENVKVNETRSTTIMSTSRPTEKGGPLFKIRRLLGRRNTKKKGPSFPPYFSHMVAHRIFDGDGIFLHKQGDRMRRANVTFRDYQTPTSSDAMALAFRRWLERATDVSLAHGQLQAAASVAGGASYDDTRPRSELLDRYHSHTQHCPLCLSSVRQLEQEQTRKQVILTAFTGATGALAMGSMSTMIVGLLSLFWSLVARQPATTSPGGAVSAILLRISVAATMGSLASLAFIRRIQTRLAWLKTEIRKFYFEDYVHAEKDD